MSRKRLSSVEIQAVLNEDEELGDTVSDDDEEIDGVISGGSASTEDSDEDVGDLLSTMHFREEIGDGKAAKPIIILDYNATKSGVDTMNKLVRT